MTRYTTSEGSTALGKALGMTSTGIESSRALTPFHTLHSTRSGTETSYREYIHNTMEGFV